VVRLARALRAAGRTRCDVGGPGPVLVDLEVAAPAGADQSRGDVQESVAQGCRLAAGQVAVEAEGLHPGQQVAGGEDEFEPDLVQLVGLARYL
jgi:hypothetical protein